MNANRSQAKDALAWTILHGGWFAAKAAVTTGAVAAGLMDKGTAKALTKMLSKMVPHMKDHAWRHYERTGSIFEMVQIAAGTSEKDVATWCGFKNEIQQGISLVSGGSLKCENTTIIRNGVSMQRSVYLETMNNKPCLNITGGEHDFVIFMDNIRQVYDYSEDGKTFLAVKTEYNNLLIQLPENTRAKWKEKIQSLR